MRVLVKRAPLKGMLRWAQRLLFSVAILILGYCAFVGVDAWVFQQRESLTLQRLLDSKASTRSQFKLATTTPGLPAIATGGLIGRIEIQRLGL